MLSCADVSSRGVAPSQSQALAVIALGSAVSVFLMRPGGLSIHRRTCSALVPNVPPVLDAAS